MHETHLITDVITAGDLSAAAFDPYTEERRERMRRLRYSSAGTYLFHGFGPDARARRIRLREKFTSDPMSSPMLTALVGAWLLPEAAYSDAAWKALVAA